MGTLKVHIHNIEIKHDVIAKQFGKKDQQCNFQNRHHAKEFDQQPKD
jgi:hypothetical protein